MNIYVIMGVSGSGKTAIGRCLAAKLDIQHFDADDFHNSENICRMRKGTPLTDEDRIPWLRLIYEKIKALRISNTSAVIGCSGLKVKYRSCILGADTENEYTRKRVDSKVIVVFLKGSYNLLKERIRNRNHFFNASLIDHQFEILEEPTEEEIRELGCEKLIIISVDKYNIEGTVQKIIEEVKCSSESGLG